MSLLFVWSVFFLVIPTLTSILLNLAMYFIYFAPRNENVQSFRIGFGKVWRRFKLPLIKCPIEICNLPVIKSDIILNECSTFYHKSKSGERSVALIVAFQIVTSSLLFLGIPILCFLLKEEDLLLLLFYIPFVFASLAVIPTIGAGLFITAIMFRGIFEFIFLNQFFDLSFDSIQYAFADQAASVTTGEDILSFMMSLITLVIGYATINLLTVFPSTLGGKLILPLFDAMPKVGEAPNKRIVRRNAALISILIYIGLIVSIILYLDI